MSIILAIRKYLNKYIDWLGRDLIIIIISLSVLSADDEMHKHDSVNDVVGTGVVRK